MAITLTWDTIIKIGAILVAIGTIVAIVFKFVRWVDKTTKLQNEVEEINAEQQLLVYGVLSCLRGLQEQGCDGTVSGAIDMIEKHINEKAHKADISK